VYVLLKPEKIFMNIRVVFCCCAGLCLLSVAAPSDDWPMYLHDTARSGVTPEKLSFPLQQAWVYRPLHAPAPAWPKPAPYDYWHKLPDLKPVVVYDRVYHAVIAEGRLYFGTSSDDRVCCLDAASGEMIWEFLTGGPVRLAPSVAEGRVYAGSDDGYVYCLDGVSGRLLWRRGPRLPRRLPGNGRIISETPVRTGVLVADGTAYYCSGLFPSRGVFRTALDAVTGRPIWEAASEELSPQGYLLASGNRLFIPTGRTNPAVFDRASGKYLADLESGGGAFAVLAEDAMISGPGRRTGNELRFSDPGSGGGIATAEGVRMTVRGPMAYIQSLEKLRALDRPAFLAVSREINQRNEIRKGIEDRLKAAEQRGDADRAADLKQRMAAVEAELAALGAERAACYTWERESDCPYALILAGDTLIAGGDGRVAAYRTEDGAECWQAPVDGRAYGLSIADGRLHVSTDTGAIYSFSAAAAGGEAREIRETAVTTMPWEDSEPAAAVAEKALAVSGREKGWCVVLGAGRGRIPRELAQRSQLQILGLEKDAAVLAEGRQLLARTGLSGARLTLQETGGGAVPLTSRMANLVVSGRIPGVSAAEVWRILAPGRGIAVIPGEEAALRAWLGNVEGGAIEAGCAVIRRAPVPEGGEWTQLYADAGHTAANRDPVRGPLMIQWFGEPGPQRIIDRHHRPMSPLYRDGRLFVTGNEVVYCVEAYNGSLLWQLEVPGTRRIGALKNCGHMLLTEDLLYIARKDECLAVKAENGGAAFTFKAPLADGVPRDWGYLNRAGNLLIGSAQQQGASFSEMSELTCGILEGDHRFVMISNSLFAVDRFTGELKWQSKDGAVMNNAIALGNGTLFFCRSRNAHVTKDTDGRIAIRHFCEGGVSLVAVRADTGEVLWETPVELPFEHIMYLNGADGVLILSGTHNVENRVYYSIFAYDMASGAERWRNVFRAYNIRCTDYTEPGGTHGEQWQHPVISGGKVYARPLAFDLQTGEKLDYMARRGGHGCGGLTGSRYYLYGRGNNPRMYPVDTAETEGIPISRVSRPGCWLNIIPGGDMIMIPESSSGCTCAYPLQTSMAFIPVSAIPEPLIGGENAELARAPGR
jgi:outer membrane protein assembly factor BamB